MNWANFAIKALQLAAVADQQYEATQAAGSASAVLQPNNFNNLILELAAIAAPAAPAEPPPA